MASKIISVIFLCMCCVVVSWAQPVEGTHVVLSQSTVDFGRITTGTVAFDTVWIKPSDDIGGQSLIFQRAELAITAPGGDFGLRGTPSTLKPITDSVPIVVLYAPRHNVQRKAVLFITVRDGIAQYTVAVRLQGDAHYVDTTYNFTDNLWGGTLLSALRTYVKGHTALTYNQARDLMFEHIDKRTDDTLECPYSGRKIRVINRQDAQNNHQFNTEHTWPQSRGAETEPPKSDLFHLRATDLTINEKRANYPFGNVESNVQYQQGGSKLGTDKSGSVVFEVRTMYKGDIARGMLYFATCYDNPSEYLTAQETVLRQWSTNDPVSSEEQQRNAAIEQWQKRRNPFIDHPEFLERIYSISGKADFPLIANPVLSDTFPTFGEYNRLPELPLLLGNTGTDTAFVRSVEVEYNGEPLAGRVVSADSTLAPGGVVRIVVRRPDEALGKSDSMRVVVKFRQGVGTQEMVVRWYGTTDIADDLRAASELSVFPNPFDRWMTIALSEQKPCSHSTVKIYALSGEELLDVTPLVQWDGNRSFVRFSLPSSVAFGTPLLCSWQCGDRVMTHVVMRMK